MIFEHTGFLHGGNVVAGSGMHSLQALHPLSKNVGRSPFGQLSSIHLNIGHRGLGGSGLHSLHALHPLTKNVGRSPFVQLSSLHLNLGQGDTVGIGVNSARGA